MTFQYFFFDTYPGFFLEALPIALAVTLVYYLVQLRADQETPRAQKGWSCAFACYIAGLICLVLLLDVMRIMWFFLLYHRKSGIFIRFFQGNFNFIPDFFTHINKETIGNVLAFLPFGILYPLAHPKATFRKTICVGIVIDLAIEILQPIFGRALDINDIILNTFAIVLSAAAYFTYRKLVDQGKKTSIT